MMCAALCFVASAWHSPRSSEVSSLQGVVTYSRLTAGTWQVWQFDLKTGVDRQLTTGLTDKRHPAKGPGALIFYHNSNQETFSVNPANGESLRVLEGLSPVRSAVASPDGSQIIFSKIRTDIVDSSNLWIARVDGADPRPFTMDGGIQDQPSWSPNGRTVAYAAGHGYGTYEIYLLEIGGRVPTQLTKNKSYESFPTWSPDGSTIAYSSEVTGDYEIWTMDPKGESQRQLTQSPGLDSTPSWSPDGRWLAFTSRRSGELEVWVCSSDGSGQRSLVATGAPACDPCWQ